MEKVVNFRSQSFFQVGGEWIARHAKKKSRESQPTIQNVE